MTPPVPEYLSPLRWRWILLTTRHREVRFLYWPPQHPTAHRNLRMLNRTGYDIGQLRLYDAAAAVLNQVDLKEAEGK